MKVVMSGRVELRRSCVVLLAMAAAPLACSATERAFGGAGEGGGATGTATTTTTTTTAGGAPSSSSVSSGSQGGGEAEGGGGSGPATVGSGGGGGQPDGCGDGDLDPGEECDDGTDLCDADCQLDCPAGWLESEGSCFGVAVGVGGTVVIDGLAAAARCGELDVVATGHRALPAAPLTADQFLTLARACPNNGCWMGYFNLAPLGSATFFAPATGDTMPADAPFIDGGMHPEDVAAACTILEDADTDPGPDAVTPAMEARDCLSLSAYFACELRPGRALITGCGNGVEGADEECDGGEHCSGCDRRCPEGWLEDPASHACTVALADQVPWADASAACTATGVAGARLATPDDPADVRIVQFTAGASSAWLGLQVLAAGRPSWISGENFDYTASTWPMASGLGIAGDVGFIFNGSISVGAPDIEPRRPLCEAFAGD